MDNLNYEVYGQGEPLIFLHGFGANLGSWKPSVPYLEKKYQLFLLDLKGFGQSLQPRDGKYSIFDQADLVLDFIAQKNLKDVTLIGNSYGGGVALVSSLRLQPADNIKALILIDSISYKQLPPLYLIILRFPILRELLLQVPHQFAIKKVMRSIYYDPRKVSSEMVTNYTIPTYRAGYPYALKEVAKQLLPLSPKQISRLKKLQDEYASIKVPTLIIHGQQDKVIPVALSQRLHKEIASSKLVVIPDCGHVPQEEFPELTAQKIETFLSSIYQT